MGTAISLAPFPVRLAFSASERALLHLPSPLARDLIPEAACTLSPTVRGGGSATQQRGHHKLGRKTRFFPEYKAMREPSLLLCVLPSLRRAVA